MFRYYFGVKSWCQEEEEEAMDETNNSGNDIYLAILYIRLAELPGVARDSTK
jgi:hypothetical protein